MDARSAGLPDRQGPETLNPVVASAIIHLVFLTDETEFKDYKRAMRAILDGVGCDDR